MTISPANDGHAPLSQVTVRIMAPAATERLARLLRALADPTRLRLLALIDAAPERQATVGELTAEFEMTQPAISHHLKVLTEAGILLRAKRGSWVWYRIDTCQLHPIASLVPGPAFLRPADDGTTSEIER